MKVQAVRFLASTVDRGSLQCNLDLQTPENLREIKEQELPTAYVVSSEHLSKFLKYSDLITDRKKKNIAKGLAHYLLGRDRIPIIEGEYSHAGQLKRSVCTLLKHAVICGDHNAYVIGIDKSIFLSLWKEAGVVRVKREGKINKFDLPSLGSMYEEIEEIPPEIILEKLDRYKEPPELAKCYVGTSAEAQLVRQWIIRASQMDHPVLILGDTGTGKEIVANEIHNYSDRSKELFLKVDCGAISPYLFESEFFGHEKGAFTSAHEGRSGFWEQADKGTMFLDEIGNLSLDHQAKLLRALDDGVIRKLGSKSAKGKKVSARIIAATNRDLSSMVKQGQFREDLYYRLRVFTIRTYVLRDHPEDIPILATFFWKVITKSEKNALPNKIINELLSYSWPGNAREMRSVLISLHGNFKMESLSVENLRMAFYLAGQRLVHDKKEIRRDEKTFHKMDCLRHLKRVEEVIDAGRNAIETILKNITANKPFAMSADEILHMRISELEILCLHPLLFYSEEIFSDVNQLKGRLAYFHSLMQGDMDKAKQYGHKDVLDGFEHVLKRVANIIRLLQTSTS